MQATFLIRNILQFDKNLAGAVNRIETAKRTCAFYLGLGERETSAFDLVQNSYQYVNVFNSSQQMYPGHPVQPVRLGLT